MNKVGAFRELRLPREGIVCFTFALRKNGRHGVCLGAAHADTTKNALELVGLKEFDHDKASLIAGTYHLNDHTLTALGIPEHVALIKKVLNANRRMVK